MFKRLIPLFAISLFISFFTACDETNLVTQGDLQTITGVVTDGQDQPISNALVEAHNTAADIQSIIAYDSTDESGNYSLKNVPTKTDGIVIKIYKDGYKSIEQNLDDFLKNSKSEDKGHHVKLLQEEDDDCCGKINLYVTDGDGNSINEAEVKLNKKQDLIQKKYTNNDGKLEFENVCDGQYWLRIAKANYKVIEKEFEIGKCDTLNFEFQLESLEPDSCCKGILIVIPKDNYSSEILNGAQVKLWQDGKLVGSAKVINGKAVIDGICPGKYWVDVLMDGYIAIEFETVFECKESKEIVKELKKKEQDCCNAQVTLNIKDKSTDLPVAEVTIKLWKNGKVIADGKTNSNGSIIFNNLCEGKIAGTYTKSGYKESEFSMEIACDDTLEFNKYIELKDAEPCCDNVLRVQAKEIGGGAGIQYFNIKLWKDGKIINTLITNHDGWVEFTGICKGKYGVSLSHENWGSKEFEIEFDCGQVKEKIIEFEKMPCCDNAFSLVPKDNETGTILNGAIVKLYQNGKVVKEALVKENKAFFDGICKGKYVGTVSMEGFATKEFEISFDCSEEKALELNLTRKECCDNILILYVTNKEDGKLISGAKVKLYKDGKIIEDPITKDGKAVIDGICKGKYVATIEIAGFESQEFEIQFDCKETKEMNISLVPKDCCKGAISVTPIDKESKEILNGATIKLWKDGKLIKEKKVENCKALFEELCEGKYGVDIIMEGWKSIEFSSELGCNKIIELTKELEKKQ